MIKILVIGCNGFIGSHVVELFRRKKEFEVYGCDMQDLKSQNYFYVKSENAIEKLIKENDYSICINCAGSASVPDSITNPLHDFDSNVLLLSKLLFYLKSYSPNCKLIQLSSAAVYGNPQKLPTHENDLLAPVSPYGCHKLMAEELCEMYYRVFGIKSAILRIFSAYGPGLKRQLFWDLYQKSLDSDKIVLFGTGLESRDFIFIDDIVTAILCVIHLSPFNADVINCANGKEITVKEAAKTFLSNVKPKCEIIFNQDCRKGDPINWCADISKLQSYGYQSKFEFNDGIKKYITWLVNEKK